jgi:hypothetical protein
MTAVTPPVYLGFKQLTSENWLHVDPAWGGIVMPSSDPDPSKAWVKDVLEARLPVSTPPNIVRLFEVARGALVYSLMFYPLIALALDQFTRVREAAVAAKCRALGAPPGVKTFANGVEWLIARGTIPVAQHLRWWAAVKLRNEASHPDDQSLYPPGWAFTDIGFTVEMIATLFQDAQGGTS